MLRMPTAVLMMIGHTDVMKMTKIAEGWPSRNAASEDRKSTRLNSSHVRISYAVFCLKKKKTTDYYYSLDFYNAGILFIEEQHYMKKHSNLYLTLYNEIDLSFNAKFFLFLDH